MAVQISSDEEGDVLKVSPQPGPVNGGEVSAKIPGRVHEGPQGRQSLHGPSDIVVVAAPRSVADPTVGAVPVLVTFEVLADEGLVPVGTEASQEGLDDDLEPDPVVVGDLGIAHVLKPLDGLLLGPLRELIPDPGLW